MRLRAEILAMHAEGIPRPTIAAELEVSWTHVARAIASALTVERSCANCGSRREVAGHIVCDDSNRLVPKLHRCDSWWSAD